jgi:hypothetical protein
MYDTQVTQGSPNSMPPQHIRSTKKNDNWGRKCVLAIKSMSTVVDDMGRSSRENKEVNYDLVNSRFREEDFDYVLNPMGIDMKKYGGTPTKMQNYNIIRSRLETLRGEEMNSSLDFFVYAIAGEAVSAKKQKKKDMLKDLMKAHIRMELQLDDQITQLESQMSKLRESLKTVQDQEQQQQIQQQLQQAMQQRNNLPDIQAEMKKFNSEYVDPTETTNTKILKMLKRNDQLALKFNLGWFHALVSAEEVYYTGITKGHPSTRTVNPLQFDYDKGANTTFIHKGNWAKEEEWLPIGEFIAEFGDVLTDAQVKRISSGEAGHSYMQGGMQQSFAYSYDGGQRRNHGAQGVASHVYFMRCSWRSYKKVGMLSYQDPRSGKWEELEVDDTFKMTPELKGMGAQVDWMWDDEIWEGALAGQDMFFNIRPKNNQTKNLPYIGYIYNNINSVATSMVDLVKSHQYTYIIVWWRLEQELAKAKGRKFIMDLAQLPKSMGWDVDQWMYYFENLGVVWINSREEGRKGDPSTMAQFNQFQSIDMTLSQVVGQYMEVLEKLEKLVEDIMGVSPQRMGEIGRQETATGAQTSISRSTNVTKPWFYFHDLVKEAVLNELLELAKIAYIDGGEYEFLDGLDIATLKINGGKLNGSDMGVFVTNSFEDRRKLDKVEQLLTMAVQQGKASLLEIANMIDAPSMSYAKSTLEAGERKANEQAQASQKAQSEDAAKQVEATAKENQLNRQKEIQINDDRIDADILIKKMDIGTAELSDNGDLDAAKVLADATIDEEKLALDAKKEENRHAEKTRELDIKEKELKKKSNESSKQS